MKNLNVGDKVQLIDGVLKGVILSMTAFKALIEDEDGFEEEVLLSNLCLQSKYEDYKLENDNILIAIERKEFIYEEKKISKANLKKVVLEVDLHIHHLTSSTRSMTNHQMVLLQIKKVKESIIQADRNRHSKIVFIHGIGSGKLKNELENELRKNKISYQDASYERYGRGALEVIL